jgi:hypothetical protein
VEEFTERNQERVPPTPGSRSAPTCSWQEEEEEEGVTSTKETVVAMAQFTATWRVTGYVYQNSLMVAREIVGEVVPPRLSFFEDSVQLKFYCLQYDIFACYTIQATMHVTSLFMPIK